ncbi:MAG: lysine--tRNA ligase [Candidatus Hadarchaeum sp.]|uniref:lysine--tRNA ligase n=1 Tax=Candidatus Hadarchaeum sp. TaxID=2883567 RepID=UPI003181C27D
MHWIDAVAHELVKRGGKQVIASGISISGHVHIGHSNDVFIADAVRRAVEELGLEAECVWCADDYDPMRRIPWPLTEGELVEKYRQYLGMPYANIPSPDPDYRDFVDYFSRPFIESLKYFGIKVKVHSGAAAYREGRMTELIRKSLEQADTIRSILNQYRDKPLPESWLPVDAICENCGRVSTTRAISWYGDYVSYRCEGTDYVAGCGHEGEADYTSGGAKLTWRVEWPARWRLLGVTCEPFGKDHAVRGGSYDTGKLIAERVFNYEAPYPIPYEWVSMKGKKLSSSKGVVFTLKQWLEIAEPEVLRYFIFRSKPMKAKEFDPGLPLLDLIEEYDLVESAYYEKKAESGRREEQQRRIYELSQVERVSETPIRRVSYRFAAVLAQVTNDEKKIIEVLTSRRMLVNPSELEIKLALRRLELARNWVMEYAPEHLRFKLLEQVPSEIVERLTPKQRQALRQLAEDLSKREFTPVELHNHVYAVAEMTGQKPNELFQAIYQVLLGRDSGPRVGNFISALDRDFVISRFREASL